MNWFKKDKIEVVRKVSFFEFIKPKYVALKIIPDSSVRNYRSSDLIKTIADQYKIPIERFNHKGFMITGYQVQERAMWEVAIEKEHITFYLHVPIHLKDLYIRRIGSVWDKATIEEMDSDYEKELNAEKVTAYELVYKKHDIFSINTDSRENVPLKSILEASRIIQDDERAKVFIHLDPVNQDVWFNQRKEAWNKLSEGERISKKQYDLFEKLSYVGKLFELVMNSLITGIVEILSTGSKENNIYLKKEQKNYDLIKFHMQNLKDDTRKKRHNTGINASVWTLCEGEDEKHRDLVSKTIANSFFDVAEDNELSPKLLNKKITKEVTRAINTKEAPKIRITYNTMSTNEVGKLVQLPGRELQEQYAEIEAKGILETQTTVSELLDNAGLVLGEQTFKGKTNKIYQPVNSWDELCLPTIGIGGMGQGKTKGLISNKAVEAVRKGFGAIVIDAAKKEVTQQIKTYLNENEYEIYDLGQTVFSLDWCEALHDQRAKSRLAGTIISFFGINEETTGQTERYLRAAVMAMETGKVSEIIHIFEDEKRLERAINNFEHDDDLNKITLKQFKSYKPDMRRQILSPIYNRLNYILSDPHLSDCVRSNNSIDFVELMAKRKVIVFDVSTLDLDDTAIDIIVNLLTSKIDIAMRLRAKVKGEENEFPFFVLMDEPHKFLRSAKLWESAVVESRKFRIGFTWTFHYWEQIPTKLQKAIRSALPHYHLYPSSKLTFESLRDEIYPFTVEDAMKLKTWHAINILRVGGQNTTPFIAKMIKPPSERRTIAT